MALLSPDRTVRALRKTPTLLQSLASGVSQADAEHLRDGEDGWNAVFIVCHLRDYEAVFAERVRRVLTQDGPMLPGMDNERLIAQNDYAHQNLHQAVAGVAQRRAELVQRLAALGVADWAHTGVHPEFGAGTLLEICANAVMHDVDHLEQLARTLRS